MRFYDEWVSSLVPPAATTGAVEAQAASGPVLIPLCGKSLDLVWLAEKKGHPVAGVELLAAPAEQLMREQVPDLTRCPSLPPGNGWVEEVWASGQLDLAVAIGDFMRVLTQPATAAGTSPHPTSQDPHDRARWCADALCTPGQFPLAWDRGGITSVAPSQAEQYLRCLHALMAKGGSVLMETMSAEGGPTASNGSPVHSYEGVRAAAGELFSVAELNSEDVTQHYPHSSHGRLVEHVLLLQKSSMEATE